MLWGSGKKGKEVKEIVKRILLVLTAALVMAAMMAIPAASAFADENEGHGKHLGGGYCKHHDCDD